jgi:inosine-uridine nucleoside N-ribohydrolase
MKKRVFIDTDITDDIDDIWALVLALNIASFDIIGISVSVGNTLEKARFVACLLTQLNHHHIPIWIGEQQDQSKNFHADYMKDFKLEDYQGAVYHALDNMDDVLDFHKRITIIGLSPLGTVKAMYQKFPILKKNADLIIMAGAMYQGYLFDEKPGAEYNIIADIHAARSVFENVKHVTICPLDVCRHIIIKDHDYLALKKSDKKDINVLLENYFLWDETYVGGAIKFPKETSSTILYDLAPILYLYDPSLFKTKEVTFDVTDQGETKVHKDGKYTQEAVIEWQGGNIPYDLIVQLYLGETNEKT